MCGLCKFFKIEDCGNIIILDKEVIYSGNYVPYGGGGKGAKNGHYGCKHTKEAKKIMSDKKKGIIPWNKGKKNTFKHTEKTKQSISKKIKEEGNGRCILTKKEVVNILNEYVLKPDIENVGKIQQNGRPMSYLWAFSINKSKEYNTTAAAIKNILTGKTWKDVSKEYKI